MNRASTTHNPKINRKSNLLLSIENLEQINRKPISITPQPFSNLFSTFENLIFFSGLENLSKIYSKSIENLSKSSLNHLPLILTPFFNFFLITFYPLFQAAGGTMPF